MAQVTCGCGRAIRVGDFPGPRAYRVVSEDAYDGLEDPVDRRKVAQLLVASALMVRCEDCGRILIREADSSDFRVYVEEL